jgi:prepilin-type N-terminal cleavage/methylation domain-containing protein
MYNSVMKKRSGFTIVEVLVVIGVIAILTVIVFPAINEIRAKNRDAERVADIAAIQLGLSLYYNQHPSGPNAGYPQTLAELINNGGKYVTGESLITPDGGEYIYVPLKKSGSDKCIYYHLGIQLELPSGQIDPNNSFSTKRGQPISNGYLYCGQYGEALWETGIDPTVENMYSVRP